MNYVFISPYFPDNFMYFCQRLKASGVNVLGIGEEDFEALHPELKTALTEYYKVHSMEDYEEMLRACGYFTHKYGKISRLESHNEHWLEQDAHLRTDFNIPGYNIDTVKTIKFKSRMKETFIKAGVPVAKGKLFDTLSDAESFIEENGYPVCVKPDKGVGATDTFKINNHQELELFFRFKKPISYIIEEWVEGNIVSFDGITDQDGKIIFYGSFMMDTGVMDIVNNDLDVFYCVTRIPPKNLVDIGKKTVKEFNLKERFFHIEYFLQDDGNIVALEVNARPPGGLTVDMYNYACELDLYDIYARMIAGLPCQAETSRPYFAAYAGRKTRKGYLHSIDEVIRNYRHLIAYHGPISSIFAQAIGDYGFVLKATEMKEIREATSFIFDK